MRLRRQRSGLDPVNYVRRFTAQELLVQLAHCGRPDGSLLSPSLFAPPSRQYHIRFTAGRRPSSSFVFALTIFSALCFASRFAHSLLCSAFRRPRIQFAQRLPRLRPRRYTTRIGTGALNETQDFPLVFAPVLLVLKRSAIKPHSLPILPGPTTDGITSACAFRGQSTGSTRDYSFPIPLCEGNYTNPIIHKRVFRTQKQCPGSQTPSGPQTTPQVSGSCMENFSRESWKTSRYLRLRQCVPMPRNCIVRSLGILRQVWIE